MDLLICVTSATLQAAAVFVAVLALLGSAAAQNDADVMNFALNLECLEAAFYTCAAYGVNLTDAYLGEASKAWYSALLNSSFYLLTRQK